MVSLHGYVTLHFSFLPVLVTFLYSDKRSEKYNHSFAKHARLFQLNIIIVMYISVVHKFRLPQISLVTNKVIGGCQNFLLCVPDPCGWGLGTRLAMHMLLRLPIHKILFRKLLF